MSARCTTSTANPALLRLFLWEALHYREHPLPNEDERASRYGDKVAGLAKSLGVEPSRAVARDLLTLIGLAAWPSAVPQLARVITGASTDTAAFGRAMRRHVVDFTRRAMSAAAAAPDTPDRHHEQETARALEAE